MLEEGEWFTLEWENCYGEAIINRVKGGWEMGKAENAITQVSQARKSGDI